MIWLLKNIIKKIIPSFLLNWYHWFLAMSGAFWHGRPSHQLKVIGVTGTNGKSTVVSLISQILSDAGLKTASLSSVKFQINEEEWPNTLKMTMPGRWQIQSFLRRAVQAGCEYAVLEVTSEGVKQYRHRFIDFDTLVFTNLTPEHLEAHGSFENYKKAKLKLFNLRHRVSIVNLDDDYADDFLRLSAEIKYGYGLEDRVIDSAHNLKVIKADQIRLSGQGATFFIDNLQFNLNLLGEFNVYNALAAISACLAQGLDLKQIKVALDRFKGVPGRMEIIIKEPFVVIIDYAHTPDALEKVYQTLKRLKEESNRIIAVLGAAGGGRDKWKRPAMGKLAAQYCDDIILTNEDPYDEKPEAILEEIASGFSSISNFPFGFAQDGQFLISNLYKILDRREAIKRALNLASEGDIVIITGKGSEPWMMVAGNKKIPWDDRKVVLEEFRSG